MALGRAFIEVHADLKPFKKSLGAEVGRIVKETQKAVEKAVSEASGKGAKGSRRGGSGPTIKPKLDTSDADRDAKGFFGRFKKYGDNAFKGIVDGFGYTIKNSEEIQAAGVVIAATIGTIISPLLAAAIAGAITAGLGTAGLGAGIALAFQDTRIQAAAKGMWANVMGGLDKAGSVFLRPVNDAIAILGQGFNSFLPRVERIFANLAPYVTTLANGVNAFMDAIGPGLEAAFGNSGPFIQIVAEYLPVIGDAIGYFFQQISESEGARAGLVVFFQMLGDAIVGTADIITFLADAFGRFVKFATPALAALQALGIIAIPDSIIADLGEMSNAMDITEQSAIGTGGGLAIVRDRAGEAGTATNTLTTSLNAFFGAALSSSNAAITYEAALDGVVASLKDNGKNIDINTAKGRENVSAVNNTVKAAIAARDAKIKETGSVAAGNAVYATQIERLKGVLHKAGLTESQINDLVGAYDDIPPEVSTELSVPGLATALTEAQTLARTLQSIRSERISNRRAASGSAIGGRANGGIVRTEQLSWLGEGNKPEVVIPLTKPRRAAELMEEAGLSGFGGGTIVVQMVLDGKVIDERVVKVNQAQARKFQQQPRKVI